MTTEYRFETAGPTIVARVTSTMEALGDQPWHVQLLRGHDVVLGGVFEASSPVLAAREAVTRWLEAQGLPTGFFVAI